MENVTPNFKILVFPWLAYSHVLPFLELSKRLADKSFKIYFCTSAINLPLIKSSLSSEYASIDLVELQIPSLPQLPPEHHTTKNLPVNLLPTLIQAFQMSSPAFSQTLDATRPDLLIYDFFQPWAAKQALCRGIPSVFFITAGAVPYSYYHHKFTHGDYSSFPYKDVYLLEHEQVDVRAKQVDPVVKGGDDEYFSFGVLNMSSEVVLVRSSRGLEGKYIDYLSELCQKKVIPTGSLIPETNKTVTEECGEIMEWLSKKDRASTVFICFGSDHFLNGEQIVEIAKGLDLTGVNFIWVIKFDEEGKGVSLEDALPEGFLDRVKERGLVLTGWAPQPEILRHESVGGFGSHCGWSSVLESLNFGVPVIGMPIRYDQPINARLLADIGAGIEIRKDGNGKFAGEEVAKAIGEVFVGKSGEEFRHGVRRVRDKMDEEDEEAMDEVVKELLLLCKKSPCNN